MLDYTKEELLSLIQSTPERFNEWKKNREDVDLSETDFSNMIIKDVDFTDVDLNSSSFSDCHLSLVNFYGADLTGVDFTRAVVSECDFSESLMTGADCSYAEITYCNFTDCDMAGTVLAETVLTNSDLSAAENLSSARYDSDTVWPDDDMMPDGFDTVYKDDLSSLKDDEDVVEDY
jgi:uncharacterized protein YjbI with pentapeptide repeats